MCATRLVLAMRATTVSGPGRLYPCCCRNSVYAGTASWTAIILQVLPSYRFINPNLAAQISPFCGVFGDELAELRGRHRLWNAAYVGELRLHQGIGQTGGKGAVELVDYPDRCFLRGDDAIPHDRLVARDKFGDGRNVRQRLGLRIARHGNRV